MKTEQNASIDNPKTWVKHHQRMCGSCAASCCSLEVEVRADDLERMELLPPEPYRGALKQEARRLIRQGIVDRFHEKNGIFSLARLANGDCIFLDQKSRLCTIYQRRPETCRNHPRVGPRSGYCPYRLRSH